MIRYFEEGLKPFTKAKIDHDATHLDDYEELVAKTVRAETKADLQPSSYVRETDHQVLRGNRPAHTTAYKVQTQGATKNYRKDKPKAKASEPASNKDSEASDKAKRGRRRRQHKDKQDFTNPAIGVNKAKVGKKKDISEVKCYNCNKKGHFATKCLESRKPKN